MRLVRPAGSTGDPAAHPDAAWLSGPAWRWDPARLDEILTEADRAGAASLCLCGQAANAIELADRFDAVLLLEVDQGMMAGRMRRAERGNDFGRVGDSLDTAVAGFGSFVAVWRRFGALGVDATRDVVTVAEQVLLTAAMMTLRRR